MRGFSFGRQFRQSQVDGTGVTPFIIQFRLIKQSRNRHWDVIQIRAMEYLPRGGRIIWVNKNIFTRIGYCLAKDYASSSTSLENIRGDETNERGRSLIAETTWPKIQELGDDIARKKKGDSRDFCIQRDSCPICTDYGQCIQRKIITTIKKERSESVAWLWA